jgi:rubredoxin
MIMSRDGVCLLTNSFFPLECPAFIKEATMDRIEHIMERWICTVCEYIYNPLHGDDTSGIRPKTAFVSLPGSWVCPECGAGKDDFVPYVEEDTTHNA